MQRVTFSITDVDDETGAEKIRASFNVRTFPLYQMVFPAPEHEGESQGREVFISKGPKGSFGLVVRGSEMGMISFSFMQVPDAAQLADQLITLGCDDKALAYLSEKSGIPLPSNRVAVATETNNVLAQMRLGTSKKGNENN